MKKIYLLVFGLFQMLSYSQTQDLAALASGEYIGMNALFDDKDNLYGYISLYSYGKSGDKTKKFEYVLLDKNLNPVANKEFQGDITAASYIGYVDFNKKIILKPSRMDLTLVKNRDLFTPSSMVIDPKTNTISKKIYYDYQSGTFNEINEPKNWKEQRKENRQEKKEKGYNYVSGVAEIKEGGFVAIEYNDYGKYVNNNRLIKFDDNKKEIWKYEYNTTGDKKVYSALSIVEKDDNHIFCIMKSVNNDDKKFSLLVLDMKTGKEIANKPITGLSDEAIDYIDAPFYSTNGIVDNDKTFDDKIVMVGKNYSSTLNSLGYSRLLINKSDFSVDTKNIFYKPDFQEYFRGITIHGHVDSGYMLQTKDMYFMSDGSVGILSEKYKPETEYTAPKTTDLVYLYTDKDFKIKEFKVLEKEKTKWANNDYLFSQYLNDGKDVVFFYRDYQKDKVTKEKKWNLFINTVIDGNFKQEIIPISEKDNYIVTPYVGKEGYILLREFNEKEKFNKIRLEKLNY